MNVQKILSSLKLTKYIPVFEENEIFIEDFFLLNNEDLK